MKNEEFHAVMLSAHFLRKTHSMMTGNKLSTFWKAGCPKGGAVDEKRLNLFMNKVVPQGVLPATSPYGYST